jgi:peptidoglycan/LPS O-acetylase OafA/YrhL
MKMQFAPEGASGEARPHPLLRGQFPALTGFRGICILWVVFTHLPIHLPAFLENPRERWGIGVDFFLAVSGFLVTRSLYQSDWATRVRGGGTWDAAREFFVRRISRIFPPYIAFMLFVAVLALVVDRSLYERLAGIASIVPSFPLFYSNYTVPLYMPQVPVMLYITWSLAFQEQFYLILLGFYSASRRLLAPLLLAAGLASLLARLGTVLLVWQGEGYHTAQIQMWLHLRFDALSWACLAWIYYDSLGPLWATRSRARLANLAAALSLGAILSAHLLFPGDLALAIIYCFKGAVLAFVIRAICELDSERTAKMGQPAAGRVSGRFVTLLRNPWLGKIGISAYEIYLLNGVAIAGVQRLHLSSPIWVVLAVYAIAVGVGRLSYVVFGKPSQSWLKQALRGKNLPKTAGAPAASAIES